MTEEQSSSSSKRLLIVAAIAVLSLIGVSVFLQPGNSDAPGESSGDSRQSPADNEDDADTSESTKSADDDQVYTHKVAAGDSYTLAARQAVAVLADGLSPAERVAAETKLTQDAGEPYLEVGQVVEFDTATVQAAIDWASRLSDDEKAAWQPYADTVVWPEIK